MSAAAPASRAVPVRGRPGSDHVRPWAAGPARPVRAAPGVPSITWVKLTFSLAAVSADQHGEEPGPPGRAGTRGERDAEQGAERVGPAVAEHHLLVEVVAEQPGGGADRAGGDRRRAGPRTAGAPSSRPALSARPGRRSSRLSRLAVPATTPAPSRTSVVRVSRPCRARRRPALPLWSAASSAAAASPAAPTPAILTRPLVTRPSRSAPRWPAKPLAPAGRGGRRRRRRRARRRRSRGRRRGRRRRLP